MEIPKTPTEVQQGGMTTSEWGVKTYGDMGQQSAIPDTNVIAAKTGGSVVPPMVPAKGGKKQNVGGTPLLSSVLSPNVLTPVVLTIASNQIPKLLRKSRKLKNMRGGNMTTIAVPATLVIANQILSKKMGKRSATRKSYKSKRRSTVSRR